MIRAGCRFSLHCVSLQVRRFSDAGTHDANHALRRPASEKRQGTKSRVRRHWLPLFPASELRL
jgi:hypothetical protein